jgi:hypothetical protein
MKASIIPDRSPAWDAPAVQRPICQANVQVIGDWAKQYRLEAHAKKVRRHALTDRPGQCTFAAVVELDGVPMCRRHAGMVALDHLLKNPEKDEE